MARQAAEQLRPHPGKELLEELKRFVAPQVEKVQERLESPDTPGKAEKYFQSLSKRERKVFLIKEMGAAAETLTKISEDFETNLHFYNTAPDKIVRNRLMRFFFPDQARTETTFQKVKRATSEMATKKLTAPNMMAKDGARDQWRRRVSRGIDILLDERRTMMKIESSWNDPAQISRDEFRAAALFNQELDFEPEAIMTPFAMIIILEDEDYDNVIDEYIFDPTSPGDSDTSGIAITEHGILPSLSGRIIFVRRSEDNLQRREAIIRHELFHLYFERFIRKEKLGKVQEQINHPEMINSIPLAKQLIADTFINLRSTMLDETCAYLFNKALAIETDRANGYVWEEIISRIKLELKPNVSSEELQSVIRDVRKTQAEYLKECRALQIQISVLFDYFSINSKSEEDDETVRRNLLFLLSQWGPSRMADFAKRIGTSNEDILEEEASQKSSLRTDMYQVFHDVKAGKKDDLTIERIHSVRNEISWLYSEESIENLERICRLFLKNNMEVGILNSLFRSLENSIIIRQEPLSQLEVDLLDSIIREIKTGGDAKLIRHASLLKRLKKEFS